MELQANQKLNKKLVDLINHVESLKFQKSDHAKSINDQITEANKKIKCIAEAIRANDKTWLADQFDSYEIDQLMSNF